MGTDAFSRRRWTAVIPPFLLSSLRWCSHLFLSIQLPPSSLTCSLPLSTVPGDRLSSGAFEQQLAHQIGPLAPDLLPASSERGHFQLSLACQRGRQTDLTAAQSTAHEAKHRTISKSITHPPPHARPGQQEGREHDKLRAVERGREDPAGTQSPTGPTTQERKVPEGLNIQTDKRQIAASGDRRGQSHRGVGGRSAQERGQSSSFQTRANFTKQHSNKTRHMTKKDRNKLCISARNTNSLQQVWFFFFYIFIGV